MLQLLWCCEYSFTLFEFAFASTKLGHFCHHRVTSAAIARSPKGALATRVDQKGECLLKRRRPCTVSNDLGSHISRDCPSAGGAGDEAA